jgi:hypothetical protein
MLMPEKARAVCVESSIFAAGFHIFPAAMKSVNAHSLMMFYWVHFDMQPLVVLLFTGKGVLCRLQMPIFNTLQKRAHPAGLITGKGVHFRSTGMGCSWRAGPRPIGY